MSVVSPYPLSCGRRYVYPVSADDAGSVHGALRFGRIDKSDTVLIELRLRPVQERLKRTTWSAALRCRIPPRCMHRVPHLSLYTPDAVTPGQVAAVQRALSAACRRYRYLECTIDGVGRGEGTEGHFVYYRVLPSAQLVSFRENLARRLSAISPSPKRFEAPGAHFLFHVTIAYKLSRQQADRLWRSLNGSGPDGAVARTRKAGLLGWLRRLLHLDRKRGSTPVVRAPHLHLFAVRVSLIGDGQRIVSEYDLPGQRLLNRREALDRRGWRRSIETCRALRAAGR